MIILRTMKYTTPANGFDKMDFREEFRNMAEVGSLLNAVAYAQAEAPWQLASFTSNRYPVTETIYLTSGLLLNSIYISKKIIDRYRDRPSLTYRFQEFYETFTEYRVPDIVLDIKDVPFAIDQRLKSGGLSPLDSLTGRGEFLPLSEDGVGVPFARVVEREAFARRGLAIETLKSVVDTAVQDFVYAAEEFITSRAHRLGLTETKDVGLAA